MKENKLISIIITVYNVEKYLKQCIESVINQTYNKIEIIIVNDGSTDNSLKIINEYQSIDKRIKVISRENKGLLYSRLDGFKIANGEYCTFVDSDDWLELNMIEKMYKSLEKYKADMVRCDFWENEKGNKSILKVSDENLLIKKENFENQFYDLLYYSAKCNSAWRSLFKKECLKEIEEIDTSITIGEDVALNLRIYSNINSIVFIPDALYYYRKNPTSMTNLLSIDNIKGMIENSLKSNYDLLKYVQIFDIKNKEKYEKAARIKIISECSYRILKLINESNINNNRKIKEYIKNVLFYNTYLNDAILGISKIDISQAKNIRFKGLVKAVYNRNIIYMYFYCKIYYKIGRKVKRILKRIMKK